MPTTIKLKNSVTTTNTPASLAQGEVAINITDKKVWVGNAATTPIQLLGAGSSASFGALTCTSLTNSGLTSGRVTYASTGGLLTDSANMTFNGTTLTVADFTDSSLTANRVVYATTAGNLTTSANLTFNGTTFTAVNDAFISGLRVGKGASGGSNNTILGEGAGAGAGSNYLTAIGYLAGAATTDSTFGNTFIGRLSGTSNTSGGSNSVLGNGAFDSNTTGSNNTAIGDSALQANTTASNNTAVGYQAAYSNTTGVQHTAVGVGALYSNTTGDSNNAFGRYALNANTTGADNVSIGRNSLLSNTTGNYNVAVGNTALNSNTTASFNTAVGYQAGYSATTSGYMTAIGRKAFYALNNGNLDNFGSTAVGQQAGEAVTTGLDNAFFGGATGSATTTGSNNTALGCGALRLNTTASNNTAVGYQAGYSNTTGGNLTAVGYQAGYYGTGTLNTYIGYGSGTYITTGSRNTILGGYGGNQGGLDIRTASNYIVLSDGDGNVRLNITNTGVAKINTVAAVPTIGVDAKLMVAGADGILDLYSNSNGAGYYCATFRNNNANNGGTQGYITISTTSVAYTSVSDYRLKENIAPMTGALAKVAQLKPVTYTWKSDGSSGQGFLAHEVQELVPEAVSGKKDDVNADGSIKAQGLDTSFLVATLTAAIQELKAEVDSLKAQLNNGA